MVFGDFSQPSPTGMREGRHLLVFTRLNTMQERVSVEQCHLLLIQAMLIARVYQHQKKCITLR